MPTRPNSTDKRSHPRTALTTKVRLSASGQGRSFEATLRSCDLGLGGIFFQSDFALKIGSQLDVQLELPQGGIVRGRGTVVRIEQYDERRKQGRNGFALRFQNFEGDGAITLASLFLAPKLKKFASRYLKDRRLKQGASELDRLVDALIVWELERSELPEASKSIWTES